MNDILQASSGKSAVTATWKDELLEALAEYAMEHGTWQNCPAELKYTRANVKDRLLILEHTESCPPVLAECDWDDWCDTYTNSYDYPDSEYGVDVTVTCECRLLDHARFRLHEGFGALIRRITA